MGCPGTRRPPFNDIQVYVNDVTTAKALGNLRMEAGGQGKQQSLEQLSPTFLAPGTGFVEENFSTERCGGEGMVQAVMGAMESGR